MVRCPKKKIRWVTGYVKLNFLYVVSFLTRKHRIRERSSIFVKSSCLGSRGTPVEVRRDPLSNEYSRTYKKFLFFLFLFLLLTKTLDLPGWTSSGQGPDLDYERLTGDSRKKPPWLSTRRSYYWKLWPRRIRNSNRKICYEFRWVRRVKMNENKQQHTPPPPDHLTCWPISSSGWGGLFWDPPFYRGESRRPRETHYDPQSVVERPGVNFVDTLCPEHFYHGVLPQLGGLETQWRSKLFDTDLSYCSNIRLIWWFTVIDGREKKVWSFLRTQNRLVYRLVLFLM